MTTTTWLAAAGACLTLGLAACGEPGTADTDRAEQMTEAQLEEARTAADLAEMPIQNGFETAPEPGANFGAGVAEAVSYAEFADFERKMATNDSLVVAVRGEVVDVCQKKGCWMTLREPGATAEGISVRFKDYGFFMPKDLGGNEVVVEGTARRVVTSVDDLRHYAEDAGKSAAEIAAITEPREEVELIATGVRIL